VQYAGNDVFPKEKPTEKRLAKSAWSERGFDKRKKKRENQPITARDQLQTKM
jgi:hypothetical protein